MQYVSLIHVQCDDNTWKLFIFIFWSTTILIIESTAKSKKKKKIKNP